MFLRALTCILPATIKKNLMAGNCKISREQWANLCRCPYLPVAYMYELVWIRIVLSEQNFQLLMCLLPSEMLLSKKCKISMLLKCFVYRISSLIHFIRQGLPIFWAWNFQDMLALLWSQNFHKLVGICKEWYRSACR